MAETAPEYEKMVRTPTMPPGIGAISRLLEELARRTHAPMTRPISPTGMIHPVSLSAATRAISPAGRCIPAPTEMLVGYRMPGGEQTTEVADLLRACALSPVDLEAFLQWWPARAAGVLRTAVATHVLRLPPHRVRQCPRAGLRGLRGAHARHELSAPHRGNVSCSRIGVAGTDPRDA